MTASRRLRAACHAHHPHRSVCERQQRGRPGQPGLARPYRSGLGVAARDVWVAEDCPRRKDDLARPLGRVLYLGGKEQRGRRHVLHAASEQCEDNPAVGTLCTARGSAASSRARTWLEQRRKDRAAMNRW